MLVLFDVDGTLTATSAVDAEVYAQSFQAVFGVALPTTDWAAYACGATDRGIADEAVRQLKLDSRRTPEFERHFLGELSRELRRRGVRPVPGATSILKRLTGSGHAVAFATGAWEESAREKLAAASIDIGRHVLVGSAFAASREEIVREARRRSGATQRAVYVGDGLWDVDAARALHLPFVGVDPEQSGALRRAGIRHVVEDYQDFAAFLREASDAGIP
jgi:phosphoglycolate phosphatase-like HAD superfamily hydrolase